MALPRHAYEALTFEQYAALDAAGKITRPVTDAPIGATTAARRVADAIASEVVTDHHPVRNQRAKERVGVLPRPSQGDKGWDTKIARALEARRAAQKHREGKRVTMPTRRGLCETGPKEGRVNKELIVVAPWSARKRQARRVRRPICIEPDCDRDAAWETFAGMWGPLAWYCDDHLPDDCEREP